MQLESLLSTMLQESGSLIDLFLRWDTDGDGTIGLEEFVVLATRFPGLLLPDFEARDAAGHVIERIKTDTARRRAKAVAEIEKTFAQEAVETAGV